MRICQDCKYFGPVVSLDVSGIRKHSRRLSSLILKGPFVAYSSQNAQVNPFDLFISSVVPLHPYTQKSRFDRIHPKHRFQPIRAPPEPASGACPHQRSAPPSQCHSLPQGHRRSLQSNANTFPPFWLFTRSMDGSPIKSRSPAQGKGHLPSSPPACAWVFPSREV